MQSSQRYINTSNRFDRFFLPAKQTEQELATQWRNNSTVFEAVDLIKNIVSETLSQTQKIAAYLECKEHAKGSYEYVLQTCKNIWDFCYENIQYYKDSERYEEVREPSRTFADRIEGVDCDCFSTFVSSILTNLKIPHSLRMVGYDHEAANQFRNGEIAKEDESVIYRHIYIIVPRKEHAKNYITIDPVVHSFDTEHQEGNIAIIKDFPMSMQKNGVSGVGDFDWSVIGTAITGAATVTSAVLTADAQKTVASANAKIAESNLQIAQQQAIADRVAAQTATTQGRTENDTAKSASNTVLYVILGVVGVSLIVGGAIVMSKKKGSTQQTATAKK